MSAGPPRVTVVIPNWNGMRHLPECIDALSAQTFNAFEIVLVDNASSDDSVAWVKEHFPFIRVIERKDNGGFAAAVNAGIVSSRCEYVALLNNDTAVDQGWLQALVHALDGHPIYDFAASKMSLYAQPQLLNAAGDVWSLRRMVAECRGYLEPSSQYNEMERVLGACAGAALYRRSLFAQVGLFDEDFFLMHEDTDFNLRCLIAGKRCLYVPNAMLRHKLGASIAASPEANMKRLLARNQSLVAAKNLPARMLALRATIWLSSILRQTISVEPSGWRQLPKLVREAPRLIKVEWEGLRMGLAKRNEVWRLQAVSTREIIRWLRSGSGPV